MTTLTGLGDTYNANMTKVLASFQPPMVVVNPPEKLLTDGNSLPGAKVEACGSEKWVYSYTYTLAGTVGGLQQTNMTETQDVVYFTHPAVVDFGLSADFFFNALSKGSYGQTVDFDKIQRDEVDQATIDRMSDSLFVTGLDVVTKKFLVGSSQKDQVDAIARLVVLAEAQAVGTTVHVYFVRTDTFGSVSAVITREKVVVSTTGTPQTAIPTLTASPVP
jgi:hypothetical protein